VNTGMSAVTGMRQQTLAEGAFEPHSKTTRRAALPAGMERVVTWVQLRVPSEPFYPEGEGGRPTAGLKHALRIYLAQQ
jgi:IS5 family transposase